MAITSVMGNSNSAPLSFIVKFSQRRDPLTIQSSCTIAELKEQISKISPEYPDAKSQLLLGISRNIKNVLPDDTLLSNCDNISSGKKNLIQVIKKSRSKTPPKYVSPPPSIFSVSPIDAADKKLNHVREIIEETLKSLDSYQNDLPKEKQGKFLMQLNEVLMLELLSLDSLDICAEDPVLREKRRDVINELQNTQDKVDTELSSVRKSNQ